MGQLPYIREEELAPSAIPTKVYTGALQHSSQTDKHKGTPVHVIVGLHVTAGLPQGEMTSGLT